MPSNSITKGVRLWNFSRLALVGAVALVLSGSGHAAPKAKVTASKAKVTAPQKKDGAPAPATVWREVSGRGDLVASAPQREFRGVWVATVYNLDWPSKPGLPVDEQKAELIEILDGAAALHLNAIVLQVRTMCDALYPSPIEPWSYYLTGELGKAPEPFWDPLAFAVEEAHARGLELHAWFNPFRAVCTVYGPNMPESHISEQYPWLIKSAGRTKWLDPSSDFVRQRAIAAIVDVVNRYDVDAVHLDDYFYPYPGTPGSEGDFDDGENWENYHLGQGGDLDRDSWRRELINDLIEDLYGEVKRYKPWVKVGISPFGIWRPGYPQGIRGLDSYTQIYSDSRKWLREGWVDYFSPQLYWKTNGPQSFTALHKWWQDQNQLGRHLWPGMATSRIGGGGEGDRRGAGEIFDQIAVTRDYPGKSAASGQLHWHWEAFVTNRGGVRQRIAAEPYRERSVPPASPWLARLEENPRALPRATGLQSEDRKDRLRLRWGHSGHSTSVRWWLVQTARAGKTKEKAAALTWETAPLAPASRLSIDLADSQGIEAVSIRAIDAYGSLGLPQIWQRQVEKSIDVPVVAASE